MSVKRFDYIRYDDCSQKVQEEFKAKCIKLELMIETLIESPRAKALALTKLEEFYMWIGKAVRDDQIARGGSSEDVPERTNQ